MIKSELKSFLNAQASPTHRRLIKQLLIEANPSSNELLNLIKICETCKSRFNWLNFFQSSKLKIWEVIRDYAFYFYFQRRKETKRRDLISKLNVFISHLGLFLTQSELFNLCEAFHKKKGDQTDYYLRDRFIQKYSFRLEQRDCSSLWELNKYFPNLNKLEINMSYIDNIQTIIEVPKNLVFKDLKKLNLIEIARHTPSYTSTFFQLTPSISSLSLLSYLNPLARLNDLGNLYEKIEKLQLFAIQRDFFCTCNDVNLLNLFKNLKSLSLTNISTIDTEKINLSNLIHLEALTLCNLNTATLNTLSTHLLEQNSNLKTLILVGRQKKINTLDPLSLKALKAPRPNLKSINLTGIEIDDDSLSILLSGAKNISSLQLGEGVEISIKAMESLKNLRELKELKVEYSETLNSQTLSEIIKNNIHLETLILNYCPLAILNVDDYEQIQYSGLKNFQTNQKSFFNNSTFSKFAKCFQKIETLDFPKQFYLNAGHLFQSVRLMAHIQNVTLFTMERVDDEIARLPGEYIKKLHKITINNNISYKAIEWYCKHHIEVLTR
mgnify:CR=1 FL=1